MIEIKVTLLQNRLSEPEIFVNSRYTNGEKFSRRKALRHYDWGEKEGGCRYGMFTVVRQEDLQKKF